MHADIIQYIPGTNIVDMHALSLYQPHTFGASNLLWTCLASMLTTATSSDPTPPSIGHAGTSAVSLQVVPSVTGVANCGPKGCTRAISLTICRSIGGWTTADGCREDIGTTLLVTTMQLHALQHKQKGTQNTGQAAVSLLSRNTCVLKVTLQRPKACLQTYTAEPLLRDAGSSTYTGSHYLYTVLGNGLSLFDRDWLQSMKLAFQGWAIWVRNCRQWMQWCRSMPRSLERSWGRRRSSKLVSCHARSKASFVCPHSVPLNYGNHWTESWTDWMQLGWSLRKSLIVTGQLPYLQYLRVTGVCASVNQFLDVDAYPLEKTEDLMMSLTRGAEIHEGWFVTRIPADALQMNPQNSSPSIHIGVGGYPMHLVAVWNGLCSSLISEGYRRDPSRSAKCNLLSWWHPSNSAIGPGTPEESQGSIII